MIIDRPSDPAELQRYERDTPVHGAAVEVGEAELARDPAGDGRLAGACGAIDGYDHETWRRSEINHAQ